MQLQDVQAFVRLGSRTHYLVVTNAEQLRDVSPSLAILLPNCTSEVSLAVEDSMPPHGEVRDLRDDAALGVPESVHTRCRQDLARALDMPEGRPFAEYVEAVSALMRQDSESEHKIAGMRNVVRTHRKGLAQALDAPTDMDMTELLDAVREMKAELFRLKTKAQIESMGRTWEFLQAKKEEQESGYESLKKRLAPEGTVSSQEYENVRTDNERLREKVKSLKWQNGQLSALNKKWADGLTDDARVAYNQGCADTVAAFRKAQGDT